MKKFAIFGMRIRYENLKNIGLCFIAFCLFQADGYAFEAGPLSFMKIWKNVDPTPLKREVSGTFYLEEWKDCPGYEGHYLISSFGRVMSLYNRVNSNLILKQFLTKVGYPSVCLCINKQKKPNTIHRLVALAFIENSGSQQTVNHKNGDKEDNFYLNLEWSSYLENNLHALKTGLRRGRKGAENPITKPVLQFSMANELIKVWDGGLSDVQRELGFNRRNIYLNITGKTKQAYNFKWAFK